MKPNNKKNYGSNACSLLVIPCHPPVVVIACLDGTIYHAVAMDKDNEMVSFEVLFSLQFIDFFMSISFHIGILILKFHKLLELLFLLIILNFSEAP